MKLVLESGASIKQKILCKGKQGALQHKKVLFHTQSKARPFMKNETKDLSHKQPSYLLLGGIQSRTEVLLVGSTVVLMVSSLTS